MEAHFLYTPRYDQDRIYLNIFRSHWLDFYHRHESEIEGYQKQVIERFIKCESESGTVHNFITFDGGDSLHPSFGILLVMTVWMNPQTVR